MNRRNEFHMKPEGACRADTCIPIPKGMKNGEGLNLSGFARIVWAKFRCSAAISTAPASRMEKLQKYDKDYYPKMQTPK